MFDNYHENDKYVSWFSIKNTEEYIIFYLFIHTTGTIH